MNPEQSFTPALPPKRYFKILAIVGLALTIVLIGVCVWLLLIYRDAKNNLDTKIAEAVTQAENDLTAVLDKSYQEEAKLPFRTISFAESLGGVTVSIPKNWSVSVSDIGASAKPLDVFAHPDYVPVEQAKIAYALRLQIINSDYSAEIKKYDNLTKGGTVVARPIQSNAVLGTTLTGAISKDIDGTITIFPLRDKTIMLWTESNGNYGADYSQILSSLLFTP